MRVKDLWVVLPLPSHLKLFWDRITISRTATIYFVFSVLHCIVQLVLQVQAFRINVEAAHFLSSITTQGAAVDPDGFYVYENDLRFCDSVPNSFNTSSCQVIWDGMVGNNTLLATSAVANVVTSPNLSSMVSMPSHLTASSRIMSSSAMVNHITSAPAIALHPTTTAHPTTTSSHAASSAQTPSKPTSSAPPPAKTQAAEMSNKNIEINKRSVLNKTEAVVINGTVQVVVNGLGWNNESAILDRQCLGVLGWPVQMVRNTEREDLTFIGFQIWVLGMSIVAILNESVPHTIASLLTHLVATGWAGYQVFNTAQFRNEFATVATNGACHPINLLPTYWQTRAAAEIPSLVLNAVSLLVSAFLSWKLAKLYGWQTFKRVGASLTISRVYKFVLTLSIVIQLSLFFIVTSIALWLDQLWNGAIGHLTRSLAYRPVLIITLILLPPWLALGWFSVRREKRVGMLVFLFFCLGYLAGWGAMFDSATFRWTYMTWTFFGVMTTSSVFLTIVAFILGIICRLNFGKGLPRYLNAQEPLPGDDFEPVTSFSDPEKVAFPSSNEPIYSVAYGPEVEVPVPSWERFAQPVGMASQRTPQLPSPAISRAPSERSVHSLHRNLSQSSYSSSASSESNGSQGSESRRWMIE